MRAEFTAADGTAMHAERAYMFRHALLREAAYQLHPPSERARLHERTLDILEQLLGGPLSPSPDDTDERLAKHRIDAYAHELAEHARLAQAGSRRGPKAQLALRELGYWRRAAEFAQRRYRSEQAERCYARLAEHPACPPSLRLEALVRRAALLHARGDPRLTLRVAKAAAAGAAAAGDARRQVRALCYMGGAQRAQGDMAAAAATLQSALSVASTPELEAIVLPYLAMVHRDMNEIAQSEHCARRAIDLSLSLGDLANAQTARLQLAGLHARLGRVAEAEALYRGVLEIWTRAAFPQGHAQALTGLAILLQHAGRHAESERAYRTALELSLGTGDNVNYGRALGSMATLLQETGRLDEARAVFGQAIEAAREMGQAGDEAAHLGNLANVYIDQRRLADAQAILERALAMHRARGALDFEGVVLTNLASIHFECRRAPLAEDLFAQALKIHRGVGNRRFEGLTLGQLAALRFGTGRRKRARADLERARAILIGLGASYELAIVERVWAQERERTVNP